MNLGAVLPQTGYLAAPDGTRLRWAVWPAPPGQPPRGTVFLMNGRGEFIEKYAEVAGELGRRGFRVVSFDWRGQGLSTRTPAEDDTGHLDDFDPLVADAALIFDQLVAGRDAPVVILAHSMGGGLALRLLADRPETARAAIVTAPMIDPVGPISGRALGRLLAPLMVALGLGRRNPPGEGYPLDAAHLAGHNPLLTSDPVRGHVQRALILETPALGVRGVTWGWLLAAFRAGRRLRQGAPRIRTPVLFVLAGFEPLVDNRAAAALAAAMPAAELVCYPEARHEILMETDTIRARFWADVDAFLARQGI